jgi:undecaprenyl-diphosphatase
MNYLQAVLLGLTQGLTEFIPVSSSGHLIIGARLLGIGEPTFSFDVALHAGTLLALLVYFWRDLLAMAGNWQTHRRLIYALAVATLPAAAVGYWLQSFVEEHTRSVVLVTVTLGLVGALMVAADRLPAPKRSAGVGPRHAFLVGLAQVVSLIPGVSRSGATILAGRSLGYDYETATRFSFLLAIPVTAGAAAKVISSPSGLALVAAEPGLVAAGIAAAAVGGLLAIGFMMSFLKKIGLKWFGAYRLGLALLLSLLLLTGVV